MSIDVAIDNVLNEIYSVSVFVFNNTDTVEDEDLTLAKELPDKEKIIELEDEGIEEFLTIENEDEVEAALNFSEAYGEASTSEIIFDSLVLGTSTREGAGRRILSIYFITEDKEDEFFDRINDSLARVILKTEEKDVVVDIMNDNNGSLYFSDMFLSQFEDADKKDYFDNKKIWAIKYSVEV